MTYKLCYNSIKHYWFVSRMEKPDGIVIKEYDSALKAHGKRLEDIDICQETICKRVTL